ncbi:MAG: hypothetical protein ACKO3W_04635, partial [bacterium]
MLAPSTLLAVSLVLGHFTENPMNPAIGSEMRPISGAQVKTDENTEERAAEPKSAMWIELAPKMLPKRTIRPSDTPLTARAIERRARLRTAPGLVDARDLPIATARVDAIRATGARIRTQSRWLNAVSVEATRDQLDQIATLPFVRSIRPLHTSHRVAPVDLVESDALPEGGVAAIDYGLMAAQLLQIGVPSMHAR